MNAFIEITSFITLLLLITQVLSKGLYDGPERDIKFVNQSGKRIEVHWVHPDTNEMVLQSSPFIYNGGTMNMNSYIGHTFQLRELPNKKTGVCGDETTKECRTGLVTVSNNNDQVVYIEKGVDIIFTDSESKAADEAGRIMDQCQKQVKRLYLGERSDNLDESKVDALMNELTKCIEGNVSEKLEEASKEIAFQSQVRKELADKWENYTCADHESVSSEPSSTLNWRDRSRKNHKVDKYFDRGAAKIFTVHNFISIEECKAIEKAAETGLHKASVANDSGGSQYSEARKAMQAGISVNWKKEKYGDPIATLSRRVYDFTNDMTGFNLSEDGQEDLMSIQYFGHNYENGEPPDRYSPHCDGNCDGLKHRPGTRVATMVMYCDLPEVGGATQFRNSAIHIKPEFGMASFFSYKGSNGVMDTGFTEHSGCPVFKGEKRIVTQWMRDGVSKQRPWNSFNTLGIHKSESEG